MKREALDNNIYCSAPEREWENLPPADKYTICSSHDGSLSLMTSFDGVMLSVAKNLETSELIHVSERTPVNAKLCCPHCNSPVTKVAGSVRRHHYRHAEGSDCPANSETLLHEGAKYFLHHALTKGIDIEFLAELSLLKQSKVTALLSSMGINSISIQAASIYSQPGATHNVEESFKNVRPDVLSYVRGYKKELMFAWEIFVSHAVEEDKSELFREYNIPFIELSPIENGKNSYILRVKSYGGFDLLYSDYHLNNFIKDEYLHELVALYSKELDQNAFNSRLEIERVNWQIKSQEDAFNSRLEKEKENWIIQAQEASQQEAIRIIDDKINKLEDSDVMTLKNAFSTVIYPITAAAQVSLVEQTNPNELIRSDNNSWAVIKECVFRKYKETSYIAVKTTNDKEYLFLSAIGMLRGIYEKLASMRMLAGLLSVNDKTKEEILVGVRLYLLQPMSTKPVERNCLLYNYRDAKTREIEIGETVSKKSTTTGKSHMYTDGFFVDSYDYQLKNVIYHLSQLFTLEAHLGTNTENKPRIDAIRINELCDLDVVKDLLMRSLVNKSYSPYRFFR